MYVNVYLKRIYFAVYKLFLHNPDLKQMNKTKELNWKQSREKPKKVKQKHGIFLGNFAAYFLLLTMRSSKAGTSLE